MKKCIALVLSLFLFSCAAPGPVYKAKSELEGIKSTYQDAQLRGLYEKNGDLLKQIYARYQGASIDVYPEGLGFTLLRGPNDEKFHYLMVNVRPSSIYFDGNTIKAEQRFSMVFQSDVLKYMSLLQSSDLDRDGIDGLAFGVYWRVYSQCPVYGGFIEYINIFLSRADAQNVLNKRKTLQEVADRAEVLTSLDSKPAASVRPVF